MDTEKHTDTNEIDSDKFNNTEIDTNNDSDLKSDTFSVTDNKYFANNEKIRIIF
jgi:hypothetical protein